jgi:uncharacterized protein YcbX
MRVAGLYRYPVKGFTPEKCETLSIADGGRIAGDRVLGFRFGNATVSDDAWGTKHEFVALVNTPGLARLQLRFDHKSLRLQISSLHEVIVDEKLSGGGRERMAAAIEKYVLNLAENPLSAHPDRLPLRMVGDGATPRYQDNPAGFVTLHSRESLAALAAAANALDLSEHRFRSNIAIEGVEAWAEQTWVGRKLRIGAVDFEVAAPKTRCLATHANPSTGERDLAVMGVLLKAFAAEKPTFAIALRTQLQGGAIHVGAEVTIQ